MDSLKVVVDTNVFVKAIFHKNQDAKELFRLKSNNKIRFVMNKEMQNELLVTFFNLLLATAKEKDITNIPKLGTLLSLSLWQVMEIDHNSKTTFCEDPDDNKFIDCAIDGNVKYIITYDAHLNSLSDFLEENYNITVLNPYQFLIEYKKFNNN